MKKIALMVAALAATVSTTANAETWANATARAAQPNSPRCYDEAMSLAAYTKIWLSLSNAGIATGAETDAALNEVVKQSVMVDYYCGKGVSDKIVYSWIYR